MKADKKKISEMNISSRSKSCLMAEGYSTIGDIVFLSDCDLRRIKNLSENCVLEIRKAVRECLIEIWNDVSDTEDYTKEALLTYYFADSNYLVYRVRKGEALIEKIVIENKPEKVTSSICVIPEFLGDIPVIGLLANSLNDLRKNNIKNIVVPRSVRVLGAVDEDLYAEYDSKRYPGRTKLKIWYATKKYSLLDQMICDEKELFANAQKGKEFYNLPEFVQINKCQSDNGYWTYPGDGKWLAKTENLLLRYTGKQVRVVVESEGIAPYAFYGLDIEEIVFSGNSKSFAKHMISGCNNLRKICFDTNENCKFEEEAIFECRQLREVKMPIKFECEGSIFHNCTDLGMVVSGGQLVHYPDSEKVIVLENDISMVANGAFSECENARIVYIPETVYKVMPKAFVKTQIHSLIFAGKTLWDIVVEANRKLYIYSVKESPVFANALDTYFNVRSHVFGVYIQGRIDIYQKNVESLREALSPTIDKQKLLLICESNMDDSNDEDVAKLPYKWTGYEP